MTKPYSQSDIDIHRLFLDVNAGQAVKVTIKLPSQYLIEVLIDCVKLQQILIKLQLTNKNHEFLHHHQFNCSVRAAWHLDTQLSKEDL